MGGAGLPAQGLAAGRKGALAVMSTSLSYGGFGPTARVRIPHGSLIYAVLGLVIFAGLTMFDFQRLRRATELDSAPLIAASIFLDVLNVFLFSSGSSRGTTESLEAA